MDLLQSIIIILTIFSINFIIPASIIQAKFMSVYVYLLIFPFVLLNFEWDLSNFIIQFFLFFTYQSLLIVLIEAELIDFGNFIFHLTFKFQVKNSLILNQKSKFIINEYFLYSPLFIFTNFIFLPPTHIFYFTFSNFIQ